MKPLTNLLALALAGAGAFSSSAQIIAPSSYKQITVDGDFSDWAGVPVAYTQAPDTTTAIAYTNLYVANDDNYLYIRFAISTVDNPFTYLQNLFIDADNTYSTGFGAGGIVGSEMLIQGGAGYQEKNGGFNEGGINGLDWLAAPAAPASEFEVRISRNATFASDGTPVFQNDTIALILESDNTPANELVPPVFGGLVYTFAAPPTVLTNNLPLVELDSIWAVDGSGSDLGTDWLDSAYDDTQAGWESGPGIFGYTTTAGSYPPIQTALTNGPSTYYFRTHFQWTNLTENIAFVATNYLSDGAVYYINGVEAKRVRMPAGSVAYATAATGTNSPAGQQGVFGFSGGPLVIGDNLLEVETHQAPASGGDMVFGLSLTAAASYPATITDATLPADRTVNGGDSTTFNSSVLVSGPAQYQWLYNGHPIPGATNAAFTIPQVIYSDAGSYELQVVNAISTNNTRTATLTVTNTPVTFSDPSQPADVVVVEGRSLSLNSAVAGSPPFQYQWYFGASQIPDATNASYSIAAALLTESGSYSVHVSNPANTAISRPASVIVVPDNLPPVVVSVTAGSTNLVLTFSEAVDPATAAAIGSYTISEGIAVIAAAQTPGNPNQVVLNTAPMTLGVIYTLTLNGVKDLFGNPATSTVSFARSIAIDGDFSDWAGVPLLFSGLEGVDGAADIKEAYLYNDANNYYFHITLWHDIPPAYGQFPLYANIYYDTDNDVNTGHLPGTIGSELLTQSGGGYQEKNGGFNEGGIDGLNWLCLPASPNLEFEFSVSRAASYSNDGMPVFTADVLNVHFQGQDTGFNALNDAPPSGVISYTAITPPNVPPLPISRLAVAPIPGNRAAVIWEGTGTLQTRSALAGGTWTTVAGATSPYTPPASSGQAFFRLTQ